MKDIFKKYPMQEGESMGKWQRRVSRQIYEEQYADKTPEQMQKILAQYKKEHPDEFEGNNARLVSPAFSALFDRLRELNMENAIFEKNPKSVDKMKAVESTSKETQQKMGCLAVLATVLNPKKWFTREKRFPTPEEEEKWNNLLNPLRMEPTPEKDFAGRFMKDFYKRLAVEKRKEKKSR